MLFRKKEVVQQQPEPIIDYDWLANITRNGHTPDIADLNNRAGAVVFVYNDLMKKRQFHHLLEPVVFGGDAYTVKDYNGWYRKVDRAPIMLPDIIKTRKQPWRTQTEAHAAPFKGEVWVVSIATLKELDKLHTNGVEFIRKRIEVDIPYTEDLSNSDGTQTIMSGQYHRFVKVWCWVGNPEYFWDGPQGINKYDYEPMSIWTPKNLNIPWKSHYYYHPFKEYNGQYAA